MRRGETSEKSEESKERSGERRVKSEVRRCGSKNAVGDRDATDGQRDRGTEGYEGCKAGVTHYTYLCNVHP